MAADNQRLSLSWVRHKSEFINMFSTWLENGKMVVCTLEAEGQKANKFVLLICSPYLELLLSQHNEEHLIPNDVNLDIKFQEVHPIIDHRFHFLILFMDERDPTFRKTVETVSEIWRIIEHPRRSIRGSG